MGSKFKKIFQTLAVSGICCIIFIGFGYFYLKGANKKVQNEAPKVPYSYTPENTGILLDIGGSKTLYYLDFLNKELCIIFVGDSFDPDDIYGYCVDYTVTASYETIEGIVNNIGGIDLTVDGEMLLATGEQVVDYLTTSSDYYERKRQIIRIIAQKISLTGFSKEDFLYIIENSETSLTVPDCYFWSDYITELCKTVKIIN